MKRLVLVLSFVIANTDVPASTLVDPTRPSSSNAVSSKDSDKNALQTIDLKLTAVINNSQQKLAIINGNSFIEGQQIRGYELISISQNHVILQGLEGKKTLYVNNNNVKKDTSNGY